MRTASFASRRLVSHRLVADSSLSGRSLSGRSLSRRQGLTLLEVLLAITILLTTMQGVIELASIGSRASIDSQRQTAAATRAETLFAELLSGTIPITPQPLHPFAESTGVTGSSGLTGPSGSLGSINGTLSADLTEATDSTDWQWSLELSEPEPGLTLLRLTIAHVPSRETAYAETFERLVRTSQLDEPSRFTTRGGR